MAGCKGELNQRAIAGADASIVVHRKGEPDAVRIDANDATMNRARNTARKTVQTFIVALRKQNSGQKDFKVKKVFCEGHISEYLWLYKVTFDGKLFHGVVANEPLDVTGVKLGDKVTVAPGEISDWMYADKGKLVGGHTIRVYYTKMIPVEKQAFNKEFGLRIE